MNRPIALLRLARRTAVIIGVAGATALVTALPALAHVTAQPSEAEKGGFSKIAFRVPDESVTAGTVKLEVSFPADHPVTSVLTTSMPGWTAAVTKIPLNPPVVDDDGTKITETVGTITWTAAPGTRIGPGEFTDFEVSAGPLPTDVDSLSFPAVQTYDDGTVVKWDQPTPANGPEPEHPAPTVKLVAANSADAVSTAVSSTPDSSDTTARWLGVIGIVLGVLGLGVGAGAVLRTRKARSSGS
jgi:periplasmic copper chaperone A